MTASPLLVATLALVATYALALVVVPRRWPHRSTLELITNARAAWFESIWRGDNPILAVQTARNWLLGANLLASAALVLGLGAVSLAMGSALDAGAALRELGWWQGGQATWRLKLAIFGIIELAAFANLLLAVRGFNNAAILVAVPHEAVSTPQLGLHVLQRGHLHHTFAVRALCFSIPAALWVLGEAWLLGGTIVVLAFLVNTDFRVGR